MLILGGHAGGGAIISALNELLPCWGDSYSDDSSTGRSSVTF